MADWSPRLFAKQKAVYKSELRHILACGPRGCGKTIAVEHRVIRHAWRTKHARVGIIVKTSRAGTLGVWPELTGPIIDEWFEAGIGSKEATLSYVSPPKPDAITKIYSFKVWNRHGGHSEVMLFPVEHSREAVAKLLSTQFTMIWISEAHLYDDPIIYKTAKGQLRMLGVPFKETSLICDCNIPPEATDHWLYNTFYTERLLARDDFDPNWDAKTRAAFVQMQAETGVYEFTLDENIYLDPAQAANFRSTYARNQNDYDRLVLGKWVKAENVTGTCFGASFRHDLHVFGSAEGSEDNWEVLLPFDSVSSHHEGPLVVLVSGWDIGSGPNHAWIALQPWTHKGAVCFDVLDEYVTVGEDGNKETVEEFTLHVMGRMEKLQANSDFKLTWEHIADASAREFRAAIRRGDAPTDDSATDAGIVEEVSGDTITLVGAGAVKKAGWQRRRVATIEQLLNQKRIRVSAHCTETIAMLQGLRKNDTKKSGYLLPGQRWKHAFDALSYAVCMYILGEIGEEDEAPLAKVRAVA